MGVFYTSIKYIGTGAGSGRRIVDVLGTAWLPMRDATKTPLRAALFCVGIDGNYSILFNVFNLNGRLT